MKNHILKWLHTFIPITSLFMLFSEAAPRIIATYLAYGIIFSLVVYLFYEKLEWQQFVHKQLVLLDSVITIMIAYDFYTRWIPSKKVAVIANIIHLSATTFLFFVACIIGIMASGAIDGILWIIYREAKKLVETKQNKKDYYTYFSIGFVLLFQYISLQYSSLQSLKDMCWQDLSVFIYNMLFSVAINIIVLLVLQNWKNTLCVTSILFGIWSIANYYVILFHGSPLYVSELRNMGTAFAVATGYSYSISMIVVCVGLILVMELQCIFKCISVKKATSFGRQFMIRIGTLGICCVIIFFTKGNVIGDNRPWMSWSDSIEYYGFMVCAIEDITGSVDPIIEPSGYELAKISDLPVSDNQDKNTDELPDIIMILNESFYDLSYYASITTDVDYLEDFYSIPNAQYGHAVCSNTGGGTNNSEFELLFSKSMHLLAGDAPFTYLNHTLVERSVVTYLEQLGYTTTGMHCGGENNYSRNVIYPKIGFDNIFLGPDSFNYISSNGNRSWMDADNYKDLIDYYDNSDDNPQFMYLLTFQNHGGFEQNEDSVDTVHVQEDYGSLTDDINEYLSSVKLSAEAFKELTEYYLEVDRDVIICMVGDHAPSFIAGLAAKKDAFIEDDSINARMVPYVIWSNYGVDLDEYSGYASMVDMMPLVLEAADVPLSTFYSHILELHEKLPVRTREGKCVDSDGVVSVYGEENAFYDLWREYFYLEYNSLMDAEEYREELFLP